MKAAPLVIPAEILAQHVVVLGKTGSGKSSVLRHMVEHLLAARERVCVVDPKGDWWGLPSSADGKGEGFPVVLFGDFKNGRSDVPMDARAGKEVAQIIASSNQACVLGFCGWRVADMTQFWIDFASELFKANRAKLHLVVDEAHNFAPKGKILSPQAGEMLHWTNRLASEGRGMGIRLLLASQRPQKVHNDTLTSCETLVAMRVVHKSDRDAVKDWIDGCGDGVSGGKVLSALAQMKVGQAWVWFPDGDYLQEVTFPLFRSFDSFSDKAIAPPTRWAKVNIEAVKAKLARVVEAKKANDPAVLQAQVRQLQAEIVKLEAKLTQACEMKAKTAKPEIIKEVRAVLPINFKATVDEFFRNMAESHKKLHTSILEMERSVKQAKPERHAPPEREPMFSRGMPANAVRRPAGASVTFGDVTLSEGEFRILRSMFWLRNESTTPRKVAFFADYTVNGHFNNLLGLLRKKGFAEGWTITEPGINLVQKTGVEDKPTGPQLREWFRPKMNELQNQMLDVLLQMKGTRMTMFELCRAVGKTENGHTNNIVGQMRTMGVIEGYARDGGMKVADEFLS